MTERTPMLMFKRLEKEAVLPVRASMGAACMDLHCIDVGPRGEFIAANKSKTFRTGLSVQIPSGYVLLIFSRSGHGFKNDVCLANSVGVIDSDYRGEILVRLTCGSTQGGLIVENGMRIAQAMLLKLPEYIACEVDELDSTDRGTGGFGSTGEF